MAGAERESIEEAFAARRDALERLAFLLGAGHEGAQDAVQAVFADAVERWDIVDDSGAYLRRAVVNRVSDSHRRTARWRRLPRAREQISELPEIDETWRLIQSLPPVQREVLVLRFYEDLEPAEIAEVVGRNPATVRSDLRRGLERLRRRLA